MARKAKTFTMIGGPFDGHVIPDNPREPFCDGDTYAVNFNEANCPNSIWGPESVYDIVGDKMVFNPGKTLKRRAIVAAILDTTGYEFERR